MSTEEGHRNGIIHIIPMTRTIIRTTKRMIARALHVQSHLRMFTCVILSHCLTTLTFFVQQSHIDAWYIARLNASHNGRFRSSKFHTNTFPYSFFLATVYDQNLHFSVARIFCYFGSCANCEDPIFLLLKLYFHSKFILFFKKSW